MDGVVCGGGDLSSGVLSYVSWRDGISSELYHRVRVDLGDVVGASFLGRSRVGDAYVEIAVGPFPRRLPYGVIFGGRDLSVLLVYLNLFLSHPLLRLLRE